MTEDGTLGGDRIKHLEFIQAVITRLANNSFLVRGWTMTVAGAFFALVASKPAPWTAAAGLVPILAFWLLDGYFLWQERLFRCLYDAVRRRDPQVEPMSMNVGPYRTGRTWRAALLSPTVLLFAGPLVVLDLVVIVVLLVAGR